jgi:DGQHR domain-containing protein
VAIFKYQGVLARQSAGHKIISVVAKASDVSAFASMARAGRDATGALHGFQRPQIAGHIREIREYLRTPDAVLPSSIVVGFTNSVEVRDIANGIVEVSIDASNGPPGYVIDGQQRLSALAGLPEKDFDILVSVLVCPDLEELRRQFVLLNSVRPLPKELVYELLPGIPDLPNRRSSRGFAAQLTERLNFDPASSLRGLIYQHTNPSGIIRDTAIQKLIMHSLSDGAIRAMPEKTRLRNGFQLLSDFFGGVRCVFADDWCNHTPKTSRLVHGAGVQAMGFVMEFLVGRDGAQTREDFTRGLSALKGRTAWTHGAWRFSDSELLPWNRLESSHRQVMKLAQYLVAIVRSSPRHEIQSAPTPSRS